MFTYFLHPSSGKYLPQLPKPVDSCSEDIIQYLSDEVEKFTDLVKDDIEVERAKPQNHGTVLQMEESFKKFDMACCTVSLGYLACKMLDTTHAFRANKNWNLHGATVGASVVSLGAILSSLKNSNEGPRLNIDHNELIPHGKIQTRPRYGNHHVSYVEYLCSDHYKICEFGSELVYLNHPDFRQKKHDN